MFSPDFDYYRAASVADAHKLLKKHPGAKLLAGGHSLIPLLKLRLTSPSAVVDIGRIKALKGIRKSGKAIRIGALTTHAELASSSVLKAGAPILAEAAGLVGDPQVRNCGTIGGNVAHADPASDLPTVLVALDGRFVVSGPKKPRAIAAGDFFRDLMTTALAKDEIVTTVEVPASGAGVGQAYVKFSHPASRFAVVGAAAIVTVKGGVCTGARVAVGGLVPAAMRLAEVEAALNGQRPTADAIAKAAALAPAAVGKNLIGDIFASPEYRRAMAAVYVKRALTAAFARAARA
jgi:carbon-monoxide dehydrogenase medium subunit